MTVPGANLLNMAARLIKLADVPYYRFASRTVNSIGLEVNTFAAAVTIKGSVQAVPRRMYAAMGLDFQRNYVTIYTTTDARDLQRGAAPDAVAWGGRYFSVESATPWRIMDGWTEVLCVDIGDSLPGTVAA